MEPVFDPAGQIDQAGLDDMVLAYLSQPAMPCEVIMTVAKPGRPR